MKPLLHAKISAKKFGGNPEDYIDIHNWFDSTKQHIADTTHRMVLHNSFGVFLCEQIFGETIQMVNGQFKRMPYITNSNGKQVSVRDVAEQHVLDDLGHIPSLEKCMEGLPVHSWATGGQMSKKVILDNSQFVLVD